jgi:uridine kinase
MNKLIIITGASGSGKTTILKEIEKKLNSEDILIYHFDDIGVPSFEKMIEGYGFCEKWQEIMTHRWIEELITIKDKKFIFLEGSFNPKFAINYLQKFKIENYFLFCIDCERSEREKRLTEYRKNDSMENFAQLLKVKTIEYGGVIIKS